MIAHFVMTLQDVWLIGWSSLLPDRLAGRVVPLILMLTAFVGASADCVVSPTDDILIATLPLPLVQPPPERLDLKPFIPYVLFHLLPGHWRWLIRRQRHKIGSRSAPLFQYKLNPNCLLFCRIMNNTRDCHTTNWSSATIKLKWRVRNPVLRLMEVSCPSRVKRLIPNKCPCALVPVGESFQCWLMFLCLTHPKVIFEMASRHGRTRRAVSGAFRGRSGRQAAGGAPQRLCRCAHDSSLW